MAHLIDIASEAVDRIDGSSRTLEQKLAAARVLVAKYEHEIRSAAIRSDIRQGDVVTFIFGRAEKKRTLKGSIVGIKSDERQGLHLRVMVGEGFDAEIHNAHDRDLTSNITQDERKASAKTKGFVR